MLGLPNKVPPIESLNNGNFKKVIVLIYLFLAVLGLHCCSSFSGLLLVVGRGLLIVVASLVVEHRL